MNGEKDWAHGMDLIGPGAGKIAGFCSDVDMISGFIKCRILWTADILSAHQIKW